MTGGNEAELLLSRLQSQFGDMDLSNLARDEEMKDGSDSEESSVIEPTLEEIQAWQETQFQKGKQRLEMKKRLEMSAVQRRRDLLKQQKMFDTEEDYQVVAALPQLEESSTFFPSRDKEGNDFLGIHPMLQELSKGDPEVLGTKWKRLYSSDHGDGLSFQQSWDALKGYGGPTVMLIGSIPSSKHALSGSNTFFLRSTLGFYTTSPWIESTNFFGSSDCFLFAFDEQVNRVKIFRPREGKDKDKRHYMYCHPSFMKSRNLSATNGCVHGIGVGGSPSQPRLHLTETLEGCRAMNYCSLFEPGNLLLGYNALDSLYYFDVECLEIWGVGGASWIQDSLDAQQKERGLAQAAMKKIHNVDKKQFLDGFRYLGGKNFEHIEQTAQRMDL